VVVVPSKMSQDGNTVTMPRSNIAAKIHFFMIRIVLYWFDNQIYLITLCLTLTVLLT
jgi:hypothetical protein